MKNNNPWRVIAIVFIVLFALETISVICLYAIGSQALSNETECSVNVCGELNATSFYYDDFEQVCYCYSGEDMVQMKYIK